MHIGHCYLPELLDNTDALLPNTLLYFYTVYYNTCMCYNYVLLVQENNHYFLIIDIKVSMQLSPSLCNLHRKQSTEEQ